MSTTIVVVDDLLARRGFKPLVSRRRELKFGYGVRGRIDSRPFRKNLNAVVRTYVYVRKAIEMKNRITLRFAVTNVFSANVTNIVSDSQHTCSLKALIITRRNIPLFFLFQLGYSDRN